MNVSFRIVSDTSVSETIRKAPLAEAQIALGKQKIRSLEGGIYPIPKFCEKLFTDVKFH